MKDCLAHSKFCPFAIISKFKEYFFNLYSFLILVLLRQSSEF